MTSLEQRFELAGQAALRECERLRYHPTYTVQLLQRLGSHLAVARDMLDRPTDELGLARLYELRRLDLSVEDLALRPVFCELFTPQQRATARQRLQLYNYPIPSETECP